MEGKRSRATTALSEGCATLDDALVLRQQRFGPVENWHITSAQIRELVGSTPTWATIFKVAVEGVSLASFARLGDICVEVENRRPLVATILFKVTLKFRDGQQPLRCDRRNSCRISTTFEGELPFAHRAAPR